MKKIKINKSKFLLGIPVALLSLKICFGAFAGYFTAKFLARRFRSLIFDIGNYKLHFHHWLMGLTALIFTLASDFSLLANLFSVGFFSGLIFQGVSCYSDWHKILIKES
ncbi:MAG: hypothetical protein ACE5J0_03150 [Candidatus Paceibacterales bacterium]